MIDELTVIPVKGCLENGHELRDWDAWRLLCVLFGVVPGVEEKQVVLGSEGGFQKKQTVFIRWVSIASTRVHGGEVEPIPKVLTGELTIVKPEQSDNFVRY